MFDGVLQNYESTPDQVSGLAASPRQWELVALVLAVAGLAIVAGLLFPDAFRYPVDTFF
jgi:hypothetical protein